MDIVNFRDFGSYKTEQGPMKEALLYRGASLSNLSKEAMQTFTEELKIKTVIDLRSSLEVKAEPNQKGNYAYYHLDILKDMHQDSADPKDLIAKSSDSSAYENMKKLYREIILSPHAQAMYAQIFDLLLEREGAFYIHCSAGKDRTGLAVSFILKALGVSREDIYKEYLKSNEAADQQIDREAFKDQAHLLEAAKVFSRVDEEYLEMAIETILEQRTSVSEYLEKDLGLSPKKQETLKKKFIGSDV